MGKNGRSAKMYGKVVGKDSADRPGWKGPGYQKPKKAPDHKATPGKEKDRELEEIEDPLNMIPVELQQLLLNIFKDAFPDTLASGTLQPLLQDVKTALYDRDFGRAFGTQEYLEAYSIRWSPCRALCYQSILIDIKEHLLELTPRGGSPQLKDSNIGSLPGVRHDPTPHMHVTCFGGGAAEVVAFGGFLRYLQADSSPKLALHDEVGDIQDSMGSICLRSRECPSLDIQLLDVAEWKNVVQKLHSGLITPPAISKYANAAAKEANAALLGPDNISATFSATDVLAMSQKTLTDHLGRTPVLATLLFTLNELYSTSVGKTTAFLLNLTTAARPGTLLLVVDSPGSYSEAKVGSEAKKYPMQWLLDHTLVDSKTKDTPVEVAWVKIVSEDSKWFRIPEGLRYPIPLENMRYQIHLYRRV